MKYRFNDTEKKLSIGPYREVSLATARERQLGARSLLESGVDPGEFKKQAKRAASVAGANTFEAIAREWFLKFSRGWAESHSSHVLLRLENDLFCWLGSRPVAAIEADELLETMRRIEARGALDSAHRCRGYCGRIFRYAIATARANRNPAPICAVRCPRPKVVTSRIRLAYFARFAPVHGILEDCRSRARSRNDECQYANRFAADLEQWDTALALCATSIIYLRAIWPMLLRP